MPSKIITISMIFLFEETSKLLNTWLLPKNIKYNNNIASKLILDKGISNKKKLGIIHIVMKTTNK